MPCRPTVYHRVKSLRYVRRHSEITHILHTLPRVVAPVTSSVLGRKSRCRASSSITGTASRSAVPVAPLTTKSHQQPAAVLHQCVSHEHQLGLLTLAIPHQLSLKACSCSGYWYGRTCRHIIAYREAVALVQAQDAVNQAWPPIPLNLRSIGQSQRWSRLSEQRCPV